MYFLLSFPVHLECAFFLSIMSSVMLNLWPGFTARTIASLIGMVVVFISFVFLLVGCNTVCLLFHIVMRRYQSNAENIATNCIFVNPYWLDSSYWCIVGMLLVGNLHVISDGSDGTN